MKITKTEFDKLFDDSITKKEYDSIIKKIEARISEIIKEMATRFGWYDFDNNPDFDAQGTTGFLTLSHTGKR